MIIKEEKVKGKEMADELDMTYGSYRSGLSGYGVPRWVRAFLFGYNLKK